MALCKTPYHGNVRASYQMLGKQQYRAVVKNAEGEPIFVSIGVYRNRDMSTTVSDAAVDVAKRFIRNEFQAHGCTRYRDGEYVHKYKGPAPFYDEIKDSYRCLNGYWQKLIEGKYHSVASVPKKVWEQAIVS